VLGLLLLVILSFKDMIEPFPLYLLPIVKQKAEKYNLNPALVLAVIETESQGHKWASRYEPNFYKKYLAGKTLRQLPGKYPTDVDVAEEYEARASSLGVMQVMGQSAREVGYEGYFEAFLDPEVNIEYGCKLLSLKLKRANGVVRQGLLYWNGGGDSKYPDRVFRNLEKLEASELNLIQKLNSLYSGQKKNK
jgi:hypothetical protein